MDLELKISSLQQDLAASAPSSQRTFPNQDWLPRPPARSTLTGHRSSITSVSIHPTYGIVASASEDATVKIWDHESGAFERTLKGHTKAVNCVAFDHGGKGIDLIGRC